MKVLIVLIVLGVAGYYAYGRYQGTAEPAVIESPVYAEFRVDAKVQGREINMALFAEMASDEECRERARKQWQEVFASCKECVVQPPSCKAELDPRYRRLFDDAVISSTYISFTRGSRFERNGRMVVYGLTSDEGDAVCEMLRAEMQKKYQGTIRCVAGRRN